MQRDNERANGRSAPRAILVVCLLTAALLTVPVQALATPEPHGEAWFVTVDRSGESIVEVRNGTAYVWRSESHRVNVSFTANRSGVTYSVCPFTPEGEREGRSLGTCRVHTRVENDTAQRSSFSIPNGNLTEGRLVIALKRTFGSGDESIDRRVLKYELIEREGDFDGDGLTNVEELESKWELDFTSADTDGDGIDDRLETREYAPEYGVDPTMNDTDGDGFSDKAEVGSTNATDPSDYPGSSTTVENTSSVPIASDPESMTMVAMLFVGLVGVTGLGVAVFWRYRRDHDARGPAVSSGASESAGSTDEITPHAGEGSPYPAPPPAHTERRMPEDDLLLTDEDRIYNLVREHGGRMKQATIVEETEWSKSKVSRLLSRMDEQGDINKLRVGRGNVIYFDGAEPPAARNPFDETD